ncbi:MAG: iduronate sulfatase [Candidatus Omnitrophota bacterium]|jgi:arylsulfatase A-like enzyme|nr:MAG: iduronate sulfatase [Candidatus Omnitrophota bacterium]
MTLHLSRRRFLASTIAGGAASLANPNALFAREKKTNVLFIAVDDLRPQLGCYGFSQMRTPHIDALAARGTVFTRAYCQQAVCSPSRTSLLTGLRPDSTRVYDLQTHFRLNIPDIVTLPQYFKQNGYHTQSFGKIYHGGLNDPDSWSVKSWHPNVPGYGKPETLKALDEERKRLREKNKSTATEVLQRDSRTGQALKVTTPKYRVRGPSWEDPDVPDNALPDGQTADEAIKTLRKIKDKPFFLAVGFLKPHLPFVAPKSYFDLYPPDTIPLPLNPFPPQEVPPIALHNWGELRNYNDIPEKGPLTNKQKMDLIRAYYAAVSYTDAQIGRIVDELERLGLRDNTVIVLWGDHGWQLGEHDLWCKHTNFEIATHSPLIFSAPGQKNAGAQTDSLAEFVDIYPTLCELCDLPLPEHLQGTSLKPVMEDPLREVKKAAFSQYPRGKIMGYSIRTDRYRYTEWQNQDGFAITKELYDHRVDPNENVNMAFRAEKQKSVNELHGMLKAGWKGSM